MQSKIVKNTFLEYFLNLKCMYVITSKKVAEMYSTVPEVKILYFSVEPKADF